MLNVKKIALALLLLISLFGCSRVQLAYNQLDWLIPYYINGYVELTENQDFYLNEQVTELLKWHCSEHLSSYAKLLRDANRQFQSGSIKAVELERHAEHFELFWREIMQHSSLFLVQFFNTLSNDQVNELRQRFLVDNRDWYDSFKEKSTEELQQDNLDFMQNELERWFGDLSEQQLKNVQKWSSRFSALGYEGQSAREHWQQKLLQMLELRDDFNQLNTGVELLFVNPIKLRSRDYIRLMDENTKVTIELISNLSASLSREQLQHLDSMITSISEDFESLACIPAKLAVTQQKTNNN
jgi:hypothetical protein